MTTFDTFTLHPKSTVIPPLQKGMTQLLAGLKAGKTILARQSGTDPITLQQDNRQWLLCETSGSSGSPKTIRRTPQSWKASFVVTAKTHAITANDTYTTLGPLGHSLTLYATLEALHIGAGIIGLAGQSPRRQLQNLQSAKTSVIYATPTQLGLLARAAKTDTTAQVRHIFCGGGTLPHSLRDTLSTLFHNAEIHAFFGASETSFITMTDAHTPQGSVGKAYPDVTLHIDSAPHKSGEIWVNSPYLFNGYATGHPTDTRWDGSALSIGEIGYLDENGYLFLRGRKSRMVTVADNNVFPEEIEALLTSVNGIDICAAIAQPDTKRGHQIICILQTTGPINTAQLRQLCHAKLGPYSAPKKIITLPEIPLLAAGKPDITTLEKWLKDRP